jgi:hypothetical protein
MDAKKKREDIVVHCKFVTTRKEENIIEPYRRRKK